MGGVSNQKTWVTAEDHVNEAQSLLADAQFPGSTVSNPGFLVTLARTHIEMARVLTEMEHVRRAQQVQMDAKSLTSAMLERLAGREDLSGP